VNAYLQLAQVIMEQGVDRPDRTGVGTRALFGEQLRFRLKEGFPILTTKRVNFRAVKEELR